MKPNLVDLKEIFKDNSSIFTNKPKIEKKIKPIDFKLDYKSLFNLVGLLILVIGIYFLHKRKNEKEKRKKDFEGRIYKLKDIIKNNNEFIL